MPDDQSMMQALLAVLTGQQPLTTDGDAARRRMMPRSPMQGMAEESSGGGLMQGLPRRGRPLDPRNAVRPGEMDPRSVVREGEYPSRALADPSSVVRESEFGAPQSFVQPRGEVDQQQALFALLSALRRAGRGGMGM
jgi:hypothetical protein